LIKDRRSAIFALPAFFAIDFFICVHLPKLDLLPSHP
jgi:hypothetical protein